MELPIEIRTPEIRDRNVMEVTIEMYGLPVPRVCTGGFQIHCKPVSMPNASDI